MTREVARSLIAVLIILGFFVVVVVIFVGYVDIQNAEMAKLVGVVVGYLTGLLTPVVMSFFKGDKP